MPSSNHSNRKEFPGFLLCVAIAIIATVLAGIGLSRNLRAIRATGTKPLVPGGILSVIMAATTLTAMQLTGQL